jgi:transposase-like protein
MSYRRSEAFRSQIVEECFEVGNIALVCRRHGLSPNTVYRWVRRYKATGAARTLPRETEEKMWEMSNSLEDLGKENAMLKKLLAEKEVENAILKELIEKVNPKLPTR